MCVRRCRRSATRRMWPTRSAWRISCGLGWFRQAHIKTASCYRLLLLLTQRRSLERKVLDLKNTIRHSLKAFGIHIKGTGRGGFDAAVRQGAADDPLTSELMDAMLAARAML
jgi:transposase